MCVCVCVCACAAGGVSSRNRSAALLGKHTMPPKAKGSGGSGSAKAAAPVSPIVPDARMRYRGRQLWHLAATRIDSIIALKRARFEWRVPNPFRRKKSAKVPKDSKNSKDSKVSKDSKDSKDSKGNIAKSQSESLGNATKSKSRSVKSKSLQAKAKQVAVAIAPIGSLKKKKGLKDGDTDALVAGTLGSTESRVAGTLGSTESLSRSRNSLSSIPGPTRVDSRSRRGSMDGGKSAGPGPRMKAEENNNRCFVFLMPRANSQKVTDEIKHMFEEAGVTVIKEGKVGTKRLEREQVVEQQYYRVASGACLKKPTDTQISAERFKQVTGEGLRAVVDRDQIYNAEDACKVLGIQVGIMF